MLALPLTARSSHCDFSAPWETLSWRLRPAGPSCPGLALPRSAPHPARSTVLSARGTRAGAPSSGLWGGVSLQVESRPPGRASGVLLRPRVPWSLDPPVSSVLAPASAVTAQEGGGSVLAALSGGERADPHGALWLGHGALDLASVASPPGRSLRIQACDRTPGADGGGGASCVRACVRLTCSAPRLPREPLVRRRGPPARLCPAAG